MKIEWKPVVGYEGYYLVSNSGFVKPILRMGTSGRILKFGDRHGYKTVGLSVKNKRTHFFVHRLVAIAFIPNPNNKPFVNHINGDRGDNNVNNLEWCTHQENMQHMQIALGRTKKGQGNPNYKRGKGLMYPKQQYKYLLSHLGVPVWAIRLDYLGVILGENNRFVSFVSNNKWAVNYNGRASYSSIENSEVNAKSSLLIYLINERVIDMQILQSINNIKS